MSESNGPAPDQSPLSGAIDEIILVIMVVLSLLGVAITHFTPQDAFLYWLTMIFVFGVAAMIAGGWQAKEKGHVSGHLLKELLVIQSLHWLGSMLTVLGVFILLQNGRMGTETAGLVILLILGLATFLDGIRIGWRYSLAGVYLGVAAVVATTVKNFMPLLIILGLALVALTVYWQKRRGSSPSQDS